MRRWVGWSHCVTLHKRPLEKSRAMRGQLRWSMLSQTGQSQPQPSPNLSLSIFGPTHRPTIYSIATLHYVESGAKSVASLLHRFRDQPSHGPYITVMWSGRCPLAVFQCSRATAAECLACLGHISVLLVPVVLGMTATDDFSSSMTR